MQTLTIIFSWRQGFGIVKPEIAPPLKTPGTSIKYFDGYADAEEFYQRGGLSEFPGPKGKEIKPDLIHVRFGVNRLALSRIVV